MSMKTMVVMAVAAVLLGAGAASADITTGLEAYLPFNGSAADDTGNGYDGTVVGATLTTDRFGNANSAYHFDGNDYIQLAKNFNFLPMTGVTVSAWIKSESTSAYVFHQANGGHLSLYVSGGNGEMYVHTADGNYAAAVDQDALPGEYINVTGVYYPGDRVEVWVGGVLKDTAIPTSGTMFDVTWNSYFYATLGAYHERDHAIISPFVGSIDEFRVYSRAVSGAEIRELSVPEPASVTLLGLGGLLVLSRRRGSR
jgi:hypothetical protein